MPLTLEPGNRFALIVLTNVHLERGFSGPLDLGSGMGVFTKPPVAWGEPWHRWLGSIVAERISQANLWLVVQGPAGKPERANEENTALNGSVTSLLHGLLLQGVPHYGFGYVLAGEDLGAGPQIGGWGELPRYYRANGPPTFRVNEIICRNAARAARGLKLIYTDPDFRRMRRGLRALLRGIQERSVDDRIHEFVRALEALVKPPIKRSTGVFVHRCKTFSRANAFTEKFLRVCYNVRSHVEHMNPLLDAFPDSSKREVQSYAEHLSRQIEALTLATHFLVACVAWGRVAWGRSSGYRDNLSHRGPRGHWRRSEPEWCAAPREGQR